LKNKDIRDYAKSRGVLLWQIAESLGITDSSFSRKLRHEFPPDEKQKIMKIIDKLERETA